MKRETRCALTILPTLMGACFMFMQGWFPLPPSFLVRCFWGLMAGYLIWLWTDWLERERPRHTERKG